jgi:hypothetical protein
LGKRAGRRWAPRGRQGPVGLGGAVGRLIGAAAATDLTEDAGPELDDAALDGALRMRPAGAGGDRVISGARQQPELGANSRRKVSAHALECAHRSGRARSVPGAHELGTGRFARRQIVLTGTPTAAAAWMVLSAAARERGRRRSSAVLAKRILSPSQERTEHRSRDRERPVVQKRPRVRRLDRAGAEALLKRRQDQAGWHRHTRRALFSPSPDPACVETPRCTGFARYEMGGG